MQVRKTSKNVEFSLGLDSTNFENVVEPELFGKGGVDDESNSRGVSENFIGVENDLSSIGANEDSNPYNKESYFDETAVETIHSFLLELREKYFVTTEATCFISEKLSHILSIDRKRHGEAIKSSLSRNIANFKLDHETKMILQCESEYAIAFNKFKGAKALSQFTENKPQYVEPIEITLGNNSKGGIDTYQYVPILSTLSVLLKH
uniref:Uncharacterized protein n=1 Tax=Clytia hemisphaerica TaxID=252671 RepID=A0A7M6DS12_9CNID